MKKQILKLVLSLSYLAVVTACTAPSTVPLPYKTRAECKLACAKQAQFCLKECKNNCSNCLCNRSAKTAKSYNRYSNEQKIKGDVCVLELNSFSDPLQCRKMTCSCSADYSVCMQACGGLIHKSLANTELCG
ncbi:MAG: acyltransferase [Proteobacteria bacterium]|nr:acyltransferase [Pseudomonadota bacterium]